MTIHNQVIRLSELKRAIAERKKSTGLDYDLQVENSQTGQGQIRHAHPCAVAAVVVVVGPSGSAVASRPA